MKIHFPGRIFPALTALAISTALLTACSTGTRLEPPAPVEDRNAIAAAGAASAASASSGAVGTGQASASGVASVDLGAGGLNAGNAGDLAANLRVIYFDFDSYVIKNEYRGVIEANAQLLNANRQRRMLVEGHTDDRGGREYNLALGQKRADAVVRTLTLLGPLESQIEAVSYGEERPMVAEANEAAWAKNRRAELKDR